MFILKANILFLIKICFDSIIRCVVRRRDCNQHGLGSKPTRAVFCPWERHFPLHGGLGKQFSLLAIFLKKVQAKIKSFNRSAISWHFRCNCLPYEEQFPRFPASQENKMEIKKLGRFYLNSAKERLLELLQNLLRA